MAFLTSSGSRRTSSPFNSIKSKAYAALVVAVPQPVEIRYAVFVICHGHAIKDRGPWLVSADQVNPDNLKIGPASGSGRWTRPRSRN